MPKFIDAKKQYWLRYKPPLSRDARAVIETFWSRKAALIERERRIDILSTGSSRDQQLADLLRVAKGNERARTMCCPLVARRFQIFFAGRAMKVSNRQAVKPIGLTLVDPETAVPFGKASTINWRTINNKLRRRLERTLGPDIVVFGICEIESDESRGIWRPHHHLVIFGAADADLKTLREKHYRRCDDVKIPMRITHMKDEGWLPYISKLIAFRKVVAANGRVRSTRLKNVQFREYMRYLAYRQPTSFVFSMNCEIIRKS